MLSGFGDDLREGLWIDSGVDLSSVAYEAGSYPFFALGAGRIAYAGWSDGTSASVMDTHMLIFVGLLFVIFAAVPRSLAITLLKLSSDPDDGEEYEDAKMAFTTPQVEFLKSLRGMIKTVRLGN